MVLLTATRSARDLETFFTDRATAGEKVGPTTYAGTPWGGEETVTASGAAVELQKRPSIHRWHTKAVTPGPDTYSVRRAASDPAVEGPRRTNPVGVGASPFRSRLQRISPDNLKEPLLVPGSTGYLPSSIAENPGPGTYDLAQGPAARPTGPSFAGPEGEHRDRPMARSQTAPSFPQLRSPAKARYSGRGEDTLCPGDYDYESHTAMKTVLKPSASATDFHASSSQRSFFPKAGSIENTYGALVNPTGPGAYNPRKSPSKGTTRAFLSKEPQCGTAQPFLSASCSPALTPGPGAYPLDQGLDQYFNKSVELSKPQDGEEAQAKAEAGGKKQAQQLASASVRSSTSRTGIFRPALTQPFTDSYHLLVPGPGHYTKPASAFKGAKARRARSTPDGLLQKYLAVHTPQHVVSLRDTDALMLCGFSSTESRGCLVPDKHAKVAEPATYDRNASTGQSILAGLREPAKLGKRGVFGTTRNSDRFHGFALNARQGLAPTDLSPPAGGIQSILGGSSDASGGAFRSGESRLPQDVTPCKPVTPGPGAYSEAEAGSPFSTSTASPSPGRPAGERKFRQPKTAHLSFGSCQSRFTGKEARVLDTPGPGEYEQERGARPMKRFTAAVQTTEDRQLEPRPVPAAEAGPGPGRYEAIGMSDLAGKTFNRTAESAGADIRKAWQDADAAKRASSSSAPYGVNFAGAYDGKAERRPGLALLDAEEALAAAPT